MENGKAMFLMPVEGAPDTCQSIPTSPNAGEGKSNVAAVLREREIFMLEMLEMCRGREGLLSS